MHTYKEAFARPNALEKTFPISRLASAAHCTYTPPQRVLPSLPPPVVQFRRPVEEGGDRSQVVFLPATCLWLDRGGKKAGWKRVKEEAGGE